MHKKLTAIIVCVLILGVMGMSGCGETKEPESIPHTSESMTDEFSHPIETSQIAPQIQQTESNTEPSQTTSPEEVKPTETTEETQTATQTETTEAPQISTLPEQEEQEGKTAFEIYNSMTGEQQQEFFMSFDGPQAFFAWYNAAKENHESENPTIMIGSDGYIDLDDLKELYGEKEE